MLIKTANIFLMTAMIILSGSNAYAEPAAPVNCSINEAPNSRAATMSWITFDSIDVAKTTIYNHVLYNGKFRAEARMEGRVLHRTYLQCFGTMGEIVSYEFYYATHNCDVSNWDSGIDCDGNPIEVFVEVTDYLN